MAEHNTISRTLLFDGKKKCDQRVPRPVKQSGYKTVVLSICETFKIVFWQGITKGNRLFAPFVESAKVTRFLPLVLPVLSRFFKNSSRPAFGTSGQSILSCPRKTQPTSLQ
jgi:hypothetical protein